MQIYAIYWLLTSQFSIVIGQKMQLTGCHDGNQMRNATCVDTKISIEWPYCSFLYCELVPTIQGTCDLINICIKLLLILCIFYFRPALHEIDLANLTEFSEKDDNKLEKGHLVFVQKKMNVKKKC